jgi:hypothetical protein
MTRSSYQERSLRSAMEHVFMATPRLFIHSVGSFSIQYSVHYSCLLYTLILYVNIFCKFVLQNKKTKGERCLVFRMEGQLPMKI